MPACHRLFRAALLVSTHDRAHSHGHVSFPSVARDKTQAPTPQVVLVRRSLARAGATAERYDEFRDVYDFDVGPAKRRVARA